MTGRLHKKSAPSKDLKPLPRTPKASDTTIWENAGSFDWAEDDPGIGKKNGYPSSVASLKRSPKTTTPPGRSERSTPTASTIPRSAPLRARASGSQDLSRSSHTYAKDSVPPAQPQEAQAPETPAQQTEGRRRQENVPLKPSTPEILNSVATPTSGTTAVPKKLRSRAGKPCAIVIPQEDSNDPSARKPLSPSAFRARLQWFEKNGYNTRGWDHGDHAVAIRARQNYSQTQPIFPDPCETREQGEREKIQRRFKVAIPDQRKWDDHMKHLTEEKLKALGVSTGDEKDQDPPPSRSRQTSSPFPGIRTVTPPISSSSLASPHQWQNSAPFSPSGNTPSTSVGPHGSPVPSVTTPIRPGHLSRQSTHGLPSAIAAQGQGIPQSFVSSPLASLQGSARSGSPAIPVAGQRALSAFSRGSPDSRDRRTPRGSDASQRTSRRGTLLSEQSPLIEVEGTNPQNGDRNRHQEGNPQRPDRRPQNAYGELAFPTPRGHRHNISANLEREAEHTEFHSGKHTNGTLQNSVTDAKDSSQKSALEKSPNDQTSPGRQQGHLPFRSSVSSSSRFNVEAKEFNFDPEKTHSRDTSASTSQNPFMPSTVRPTVTTSSSQPAVSLITAHANGEATGDDHFNASALPFKPPAQGDFSFSSSRFNFSSDKRNANKENDASFDPESKVLTPEKERTARIFDLAGIVKPSKASKAIPIVNPNAISKKEDDEDPEDEFGRITQGKGRVKRGRHAAPDAEEVPQFGRPGQNVGAEQLKRAMKEASPGSHAPAVRPDETRMSDRDAAEAEEFWHGGVSDSETPQHDTPQKSESHIATGASRERRPLQERKNTASRSSPDPEDKDLGASSNGPQLEKPLSDDRPTPTFQEIDAIMSRLNQSTQDLGIQSTQAMEEYIDQPSDHLQEPKPQARKDEAPPQPSANLSAEMLSVQHHDRPDQSPVRKLNLEKEVPVSDWDDVLASDEEGKFLPQAQFFDTRVRDLIENVLQQHLTPLQKALKEVDSSVRSMSSKDAPREASCKKAPDNSDADDEDNAEGAPPQSRGRILKSEKKMDMIRSTVLDAMASSQPKDELVTDRLSADTVRSIVTEAMGALAHGDDKGTDRLDSVAMRSIIQEALTSAPGKRELIPEPLDKDVLRSVMLDVIASPQHGLQSTEKLDTQAIRTIVQEAVTSCRSSETLERLDNEMELRNEAERRAKDLQRMLALSEKEIGLFKEAGEAADDEKQKLVAERHASQKRVSDLERIERELRTKVSGLSAEVSALVSTLEEYRLSSTKWRHEIDSARVARDTLQSNISHMKREAEENSQVRHDLKSQLDKLQDKLENVSNNLATERRVWQRKDEEQGKEITILSTRFEEELRRRQRLEEDMDQMFVHEKNAIKANVTLDEIRNTNTRLMADVAKLREESANHRNDAALHEREAVEAKDIARAEIQRTKTLLEAEIEVSNRKAESMRVDLETRLDMTQGELMRARLSANSTQEEFKRMMDEANASRSVAVREASDSSNATLNAERQRFEQLINDLTKQHNTALRHSLDDKQRAESTLQGNLDLSNQKIAHLEDVVKHLQDKVTIAQSAAQAAAQAAAQQQQVTKAAPLPRERPPAPSEKVSPQALRESIVVLQEQLQQRESRIEQLEADNARFTKDDAPARLKERDTEVAWLRELLGVRVDDISELVNLLSLDNYDRDAARYAAIRIRANLQMEQQEKKRLINGGGGAMRLGGQASNAAPQLPSLSDIQNFASPKAAQLVTAWGNWRRGREPPSSLSNLRDGTNRFSYAVHAGRAESQTPSKQPAAAAAVTSSATAAQTFLNGLMTPPASNVRRTPTTQQPRGSRAQPHHEAQDDHGDDGEGSFTAPSDADDAVPLSLQLPAEDFDDDDEDPEPEDVNGILGRGAADPEGDKTPTRPRSAQTSRAHGRGRSRQKNVPEREAVGAMSPLDLEKTAPPLDLAAEMSAAGEGECEEKEKQDGRTSSA